MSRVIVMSDGTVHYVETQEEASEVYEAEREYNS